MITDAGINGSTTGWGVDNNVFSGTNEFMFFDFGSQPLADPDGPGGIDTSTSGASLPNISFATFDFIQYTAADDISYVVHYTDGSFDSGHVPSANMDPSGPNWTFTADAGKFIADIQLYTSGTGPGKVDLVSVGVQSSAIDKTPTFTVQLTDGDGDPTTVGNFAIHIKDGLSPSSPAAQMPLVQKTAPTQTADNSNTVLVGALAAAGLAASDSVAASTSHGDLHSNVSHFATAAYHGQPIAPVSLDSGNGRHFASSLLSDSEAGESHAAAQAAASHVTSAAQAHGASNGDAAAHQQAPTTLLQGTQAPAHAEAPASQMTAAGIDMPSAHQLAQANTGNTAAGQHPALGQVLAEALHGGGGNSQIDHVLAQLPGHGGANAALEALASHAAGAVPNGDSVLFAGFTATHTAFNMEAMVAHVDAVQAHA
jgi:hypothetical protein